MLIISRMFATRKTQRGKEEKEQQLRRNSKSTRKEREGSSDRKQKDKLLATVRWTSGARMRDGKADPSCLEIVQAEAWINFPAALVLCFLGQGLAQGLLLWYWLGGPCRGGVHSQERRCHLLIQHSRQERVITWHNRDPISARGH